MKSLLDILPLWEVRAVVAQETAPGQYTPPTLGTMYVHGFDVEDTRARAARILERVHGRIKAYFVNTHQVRPEEAKPESAGFPGLTQRM